MLLVNNHTEQIKRSVEDLQDSLKEMLRDLPDPQRVQVFIPFLRVINEEKVEYWEQQAHNLVYWGGGNRDPDRLFSDFQTLIEGEGVSFGEYINKFGTDVLEAMVSVPMYAIGGAVAGTFMAGNAALTLGNKAVETVKSVGGKVRDAFGAIVLLSAVFATIRVLSMLAPTNKD